MNLKALFVGDINVDIIMAGLESLPVVDREITCQSFDVTMGSTAVNCACAYSCLGGDASFFGLAGQDDYGDFMLKGLTGLGVKTDLVERTSDVGTGVTVNLVFGNTRTQVTYPGTIAAFDGAGLDEATLTRFNHIHFAGPYLQTAFRPRIAGLLGVAERLGITSSLDPQWDPSGRWEGMNEWLPKLAYLFLNQDEALAVSGQSRLKDAAGWLKERTRQPVIKAGDQGAYIFQNDRLERIPAIPARVIDTTGAGDSFDAGFLFAALNRRMKPTDAVRIANATASRSCSFVGGTSARSTWEDVSQLIAGTGA